MHNLRKFYHVYGSTSGLLLVLIILTGSLFYVVFGQNISFGPAKSKIDVKIAGVIKGGNQAQIRGDCSVSTTDLSNDSTEQQMLTLINNYRSQHGLSAVSFSTNLNRAAAWMANDMAQRNWQPSLEHIDSEGRNYDVRISECGYTAMAADIVGYDSGSNPQGILTAWEGSPDHNLVLLNQVADINGGAPHQENWTKVGIGRAQANGKWYWSADFGVTDDGTNGGGTGGGGTGTGGGITSCTCPHGGVILPDGTQNDDYTGTCGDGAYTGTDGQQWTCTDAQNGQNGWQVIPPGGCINGHIEDATTGNPITKFYLGTDQQKVCGDDGNEYQCQNGSWNPTNNKCGPASGGGGGGGGQYSMTLTADQTSYSPGGTMLLCYTITPNTPFQGTLIEKVEGYGENTVGTWSASGDPNECVRLTIDAGAAAGAHQFTIKANINGTDVAQASTTVQINAQSVPSITTTISPGVSISPETTITTSPGVTTTLTTTPVTTTPATTITTTPGTTVTTSPAPGNGNLSFKVHIPGVGANTSTGENNNPNPSTANLQIQLSDPSNSKTVNTLTTSLNYDSFSSSFTGTTQIPAGSYLIKIRTNNSLWDNIGLFTISNGQQASTPDETLVTGDLNQDNVLDLGDYNIFVSCYGTRTCSQKDVSDVNRDGKVNETDLNIFYSGLSNRNGD